MQWRVLEEDVLNESLVDACVDKVARVYDVVKSQATLYYDERSHFASRHVHTCHNDRHDSLLVYSRLRLAAHEEEAHNGLEPLMRTQRIQKASYLFLKQYDKAYYTYANQLVHNSSKQAHLQHLANKEPHQHKYYDADDDVERTALLHQSVEVVKHQGDEKNVDYVFYSKVKHMMSYE